MALPPRPPETANDLEIANMKHQRHHSPTRPCPARVAILTLLLAGTLTACGAGSVTVGGTFPTPNVEPIPLRLAVYYDDAMRNHTYTEYSESGREELRVASGQSHIRLFNTVLPAMFTQVVQVSSIEQAASMGVDAVFMPAIDVFELGLPQKTHLDMFEVRITYNMRLLTPQGGQIADWQHGSAAYGRVPAENFRSTQSSIEQATIAALRDLASTFSLEFAQQPDVRDWLNSL